MSSFRNQENRSIVYLKFGIILWAIYFIKTVMIVHKLWLVGVGILIEFCIALRITNQNVTESKSNFGHFNFIKQNFTRHVFFRDLDGVAVPGKLGSRRVFGGISADLKEFPAVCALLDRYWAVRCTATVLTDHWVLTAAHCVTPKLAYVKYNTRRPASSEGNVSAIHFLYRHPKFEVEIKDDGQGMDVVRLHHDVGLVRTRDVMRLALEPLHVIHTLQLHNALSLYNQEVKVLGFGRTDRSVLGDELFEVRLMLVGCERGSWLYCVCGVAEKPRGVCSGDSGGPVLFQGKPIGVTSMGPVECASSSRTPPAGATSVFTALHRYADVINATIYDTENDLRMSMISHATGPIRPSYCALSYYVFSVIIIRIQISVIILVKYKNI